MWACERQCKAGCIDSKAKKVDQSRCVDCYNCLSVCHKHSIKYGLGWKKGRKTPEKPVDTSKRQFVATVGALSLLLPNKVLAQGKAVVKANKSWQREHPLSPPGSQSAEHLLKLVRLVIFVSPNVLRVCRNLPLWIMV